MSDPIRTLMDSLLRLPAHERLATLNMLPGIVRDLTMQTVNELRNTKGATWADIAGILGVSRQAAHERFSTDKPGGLVTLGQIIDEGLPRGAAGVYWHALPGRAESRAEIESPDWLTSARVVERNRDAVGHLLFP